MSENFSEHSQFARFFCNNFVLIYFLRGVAVIGEGSVYSVIDY